LTPTEPWRAPIEAAGRTAVWITDPAMKPETWYASNPGQTTLMVWKEGKVWHWRVLDGEHGPEKYATRNGAMRAAMEATWKTSS
jgi:hypothetical protein